MSDGATSRYYGLGIQKCGSITILLPSCSNFFFNSKNLYGPPVALTYDRGSTSYNGPSTLDTNQLESSLAVPRAQEIHHNPLSSLSMATGDRPSMYYRNQTLDESPPVPSSSNGNTNERRGRSRITQNTLSKAQAVAKPEVELTSIATPERSEENASVWNSGHPQPLRFVPIW